jgi:hypothetical protein
MRLVFSISGFRSKQSHHDRFADAAFDSPCSYGSPQTARPESGRGFSGYAEIIAKGVAGNLFPIVHTALRIQSDGSAKLLKKTD